MTMARHRTQFSAWVVLGLNLVMTGNLPLIHAQDPDTLSTWANAEAIWVRCIPTSFASFLQVCTSLNWSVCFMGR